MRLHPARSLALLLVAALMCLPLSSALAYTGSSNLGSAAQVQYVSPGPGSGVPSALGADEQGVRGVSDQSSGAGDESGAGAPDRPQSPQRPAVDERTPEVRELGQRSPVATLPFTGALAIGVLGIGLVLLAGGLLLRIVTRRSRL